jgi:light-regulated signal transduction histidine kinase (bacteriophytochrome)
MHAMQTRLPVQFETFPPNLQFWPEVNNYLTADGGLSVCFKDVTARKKAEELLREVNQQLNEYSYALTHNLKAPLRAIHNYINFLFEDLADSLDGELKKFIEGIRDSIIQSNKQFQDLETLYRITNYPSNLESFEMRELLDEIQSMFKNTSDRELIIGRDWPALSGERFLMRQILIDLINNGFKFNRADLKRVEVGRQQATDNEIEIFVRDNGIGIDPQYHKHLFKLLILLPSVLFHLPEKLYNSGTADPICDPHRFHHGSNASGRYVPGNGAG